MTDILKYSDPSYCLSTPLSQEKLDISSDNLYRDMDDTFSDFMDSTTCSTEKNVNRSLENVHELATSSINVSLILTDDGGDDEHIVDTSDEDEIATEEKKNTEEIHDMIPEANKFKKMDYEEFYDDAECDVPAGPVSLKYSRKVKRNICLGNLSGSSVKELIWPEGRFGSQSPSAAMASLSVADAVLEDAALYDLFHLYNVTGEVMIFLSVLLLTI